MKPREYYDTIVANTGAQRYTRSHRPEERDLAVELMQAELGLNMSGKEKRRMIQHMREKSHNEVLGAAIMRSLSPELLSKMEGRVFIGDFPTGDFNAQAMRVADNDGYVVLINVGLFMLIATVVRIVLSRAEFSVGGESRPPLLDEDEATTHLEEAIQQYLALGLRTPTFDRRRLAFRDPRMSQLCVNLVIGAEKFVVAHELGHVMLGHLDRDGVRRLYVRGADITVDIQAKSAKEEIQADTVSAGILMKAIPNRITNMEGLIQLSEAVAGPFLFLELGRLIETVAPRPATTHPPCRTRSELLRKLFERRVPEQAFSIEKATTSILSHLGRNL